jgi:hypothetical protein
MDLNDLLQRHEKPQFALGDQLMWCDPRATWPDWEFGTVLGAGFHEKLYSEGKLRVDYNVWREGPEKPKFPITPEHKVILKATPDPHRECWSGVVELRQRWHCLLFSYDWTLDGNDTQVVADMRGRVFGDSTSDHETEAVLVLKATRDVEVRVNAYTLWDWATRARDVASMP